MKPHRARIIAMQAIYQCEFAERSLEDLCKFNWIDYEIPENEKKMAISIISYVIENQEKIDNMIIEFSENWKFERISPVNKAILRISIAQFLNSEVDIGIKIIIDEALKIAKEFSEDDSIRFVNGLLDNLFDKINLNKN